MVEDVQGQQLVAVWLTDSEWRKVAACVAAQVIFAQGEEAEREIAALWTRIHPDSSV